MCQVLTLSAQSEEWMVGSCGNAKQPRILCDAMTDTSPAVLARWPCATWFLQQVDILFVLRWPDLKTRLCWLRNAP